MAINYLCYFVTQKDCFGKAISILHEIRDIHEKKSLCHNSLYVNFNIATNSNDTINS